MPPIPFPKGPSAYDNYMRTRVTQAGPPQQSADGFLDYPGGVSTWKTSGGRYTGGTGVKAPGEEMRFFDKNGKELTKEKDEEAGRGGVGESGGSQASGRQ